MYQRHHICVCICTYQRPERLSRLLSELKEQETEGLFDYSIVIVDNDRSESARQTVESCARQSKIPISYYVEPEQNIALARNKAVKNAKSELIAFIDDDEFPAKHWLLNLLNALNFYNADGILGPVLPHFDEEPPKWVLKGHFFDRPMHPTGQTLVWKNTRTGNVLLRKDLFKEDCMWFDPAFGSGGEDRDFFRRKIGEGHIFVWCNEASVFETVPTVRWKKSVMIKRALLRGKVAFNNTTPNPFSLLKSVLVITVYTFGLPFFLILGHHIFMKYLIKACDHLGKVLAFMGIDLVKEKYITT